VGQSRSSTGLVRIVHHVDAVAAEGQLEEDAREGALRLDQREELRALSS
jgi:hypothetical protein